MRRAASLVLAIPPFALFALFAACSSDPATGGGGTGGGGGDAGSDAPLDALPDVPLPDTGIPNPCSLPGSIQFTAGGKTVVPGGSSPVDLSFIDLPEGFCAHYFATVGNTRQIRVAPGGEVFVASPTGLTTGGGPGGNNAIMVLADDDHDGVADAPQTFLANLPRTQGMMFTGAHFYYQDDARILKLPYAPGDRQPSGAPEQIADITYYYSALHWPKGIDIADDGTLYVSNGGDQGEACVGPPHPFNGGIRRIDGTPNGAPVSQGLRNAISVRCARGHNKCFALEMAKDYTAQTGGREKLVPIRQGDDWGFPCCATKNLPHVEFPGTDCSGVVPEEVSFLIGDSPFSLAFAPASWPGKWAGSALVANHGAAGSWVGARVVAIAMDPATGDPVPGSNINGQDVGGMSDFATGWDDGTLTHGRPAAVDFGTDGRLYVGNDNNGVIFWIAPMN